MVKLNFTIGIIIGFFVLPVLFILFVLYLYLKDKIEDFFRKKKYSKQKQETRATNTATTITATSNPTTNQTKNPAQTTINQHVHEHVHDNTQIQQQETLIKIEDSETEKKEENFIKDGLHGVT